MRGCLGAVMMRKVIIDCDPGVDDALVICAALFDPRIEVLAITATGGNCPPEQATNNAYALLERLDPPRWPRLGAAVEPDDGLPVNGRLLYGADGLGGITHHVPELHNRHPSEKIICDTIRTEPEGSVTILAVGPLTNIARAFQRDPELASLVGQIVMMGGSYSGPGNITPTAEFNVYCDPKSARVVFRSHSTKTLMPLDITNQIVMSYDILDRLPKDTTRLGKLVHELLPPAFRGYRQQFGLEGIHVHDLVTYIYLVRPELFTTEEMAGDVEVFGELTAGMTVFDRRRVPAWRHNMAVVTDLKRDEVIDEIIDTLTIAANRAEHSGG